MARMHTIAFSENVDQALDNIATIVAGAGGAGAGENVFQRGPTNDDFRARPDMPLIGLGMFGAPTIERARIMLTSLVGPTQAGGYDVPPSALNLGAEPLAPLPLLNLLKQPLRCEAKDGVNELINVQIENDAAAAAEDAWAFLWMFDNIPAPVGGFGRWLRFTTSASAMTGEQWNLRTLTATQTVRPGRYQVGGALAIAATSLRVARLTGLLEPGTNNIMAHKPGFPCGDAVSDLRGPEAALFTDGNLGVWGEFTDQTLPSVEFFPDGADNEAQEVFLWVKKVA